MSLILSLAVLLGTIDPLTYSAGVFRGPLPRQFHVDSQHRVYVLDIHDHLVRVFDTSGQQSHVIGQEGAGPGAFKRPVAMHVYDEKVQVFALTPPKLEVFDKQGQSLRSIKVPRDAIAYMGGALPTRTGWVYVADNNAIILADSDFQNLTALWGVYEPTSYRLPDKVFRPFKPKPRIAVGPDRDRIFTYIPSSATEPVQLLVYNLRTKEQQVFATLNLEAIPYDEETGLARYHQEKHRIESQGRRYFYTSYEMPEYYPLVGNLYLTSDHLLRLDRPALSNENPPLFLDMLGKVVSSELDHANYYRIIGYVGPWAYLAYPDASGEVFIKRLRKAELASPQIMALLSAQIPNSGMTP